MEENPMFCYQCEQTAGERDVQKLVYVVRLLR